jgi:uncharacterized protein DUF4349
MKNSKLTLFVLLITFLSACNGGSFKADNYATAEAEEFTESIYEVMEGDFDAGTAQDNSDDKISKKDAVNTKSSSKLKRKLIKTGNVEFETDNLNTTNLHIKKIIKSLDGYIASESENKYYGSISQSLELRVPSKNFDKLLQEISNGVEHFDSKNINVKDVTEEFVDIQARLKTKKELEKRYIQLLNKANNVGEILEIEREIGSLRADIESFEGRLKYLKDQVSFSTLQIRFYETKEVVTKNKFGQKFKDGFGNGWENLIYFFIGLTNIWPFIILIIVLVYFIRRKLKQRRKNKQEK